MVLAERNLLWFLQHGNVGVLSLMQSTEMIADWKNSHALDRHFDHPAGLVDLSELTDLELSHVEGGVGTGLVGTFGCCWCVPWYSSWTLCGADFVCGQHSCSW